MKKNLVFVSFLFLFACGDENKSNNNSFDDVAKTNLQDLQQSYGSTVSALFQTTGVGEPGKNIPPEEQHGLKPIARKQAADMAAVLAVECVRTSTPPENNQLPSGTASYFVGEKNCPISASNQITWDFRNPVKTMSTQGALTLSKTPEKWLGDVVYMTRAVNHKYGSLVEVDGATRPTLEYKGTAKIISSSLGTVEIIMDSRETYSTRDGTILRAWTDMKFLKTGKVIRFLTESTTKPKSTSKNIYMVNDRYLSEKEFYALSEGFTVKWMAP